MGASAFEPGLLISLHRKPSTLPPSKFNPCFLSRLSLILSSKLSWELWLVLLNPIFLKNPQRWINFVILLRSLPSTLSSSSLSSLRSTLAFQFKRNKETWSELDFVQMTLLSNPRRLLIQDPCSMKISNNSPPHYPHPFLCATPKHCSLCSHQAISIKLWVREQCQKVNDDDDDSDALKRD